MVPDTLSLDAKNFMSAEHFLHLGDAAFFENSHEKEQTDDIVMLDADSVPSAVRRIFGLLWAGTAIDESDASYLLSLHEADWEECFKSRVENFTPNTMDPLHCLRLLPGMLRSIGSRPLALCILRRMLCFSGGGLSPPADLESLSKNSLHGILAHTCLHVCGLFDLTPKAFRKELRRIEAVSDRLGQGDIENSHNDDGWDFVRVGKTVIVLLAELYFAVKN